MNNRWAPVPLRAIVIRRLSSVVSVTSRRMFRGTFDACSRQKGGAGTWALSVDHSAIHCINFRRGKLELRTNRTEVE
jgi:hypothetical protein